MYKRILQSVLVVAGILLVLIAFAPMLLSIHSVNQFILARVNAHIPGKLHAQTIQVSWTGGIVIKGLAINDPQGRQVAFFDIASFEGHLLSFLHAPCIEGKIQADSSKILLIDDNNTGKFSIEEVFSAVNTTAKGSAQNTLTVQDFHLNLDMRPRGKTLGVATCQIDKGKFHVSASVRNLQDVEHQILEHIVCEIDQFPLKAITPFVAMWNSDISKLLLPAFGSTLNAKISQQSIDVHTPTLALTGNSLENATLKWEISDEVLRTLQSLYPVIPADLTFAKKSTLFARREPSDLLAIHWNVEPPLTLVQKDVTAPITIKLDGVIAPRKDALDTQVNIDLASSTAESRCNAICKFLENEQSGQLHIHTNTIQTDIDFSITENDENSFLVTSKGVFDSSHASSSVQELVGKAGAFSSSIPIEFQEDEGCVIDKATIDFHSDALERVVGTLQATILPNKCAGDIQVDCTNVRKDLFGDSIQVSLEGEIINMNQGFFTGHIQSPLLKAQVDCVLTDGLLTLEKPFTAQYTILPEMGVRSSKPVTLCIAPEGCSIPLNPFQLDKVCIKDIQIDPDLLYCKNSGITAALITLFNAKASREITLWATPIYAEIKDGFLLCRRFDMLIAGSFPVASWGRINLVEDKIEMTLGLTGISLVQAFALGKLDPTYMIQIPIRGSLKSPQIDTGAATSKIAALRLVQTRLAFTTPIGALFGVGAMVFDKVDAPPPPTTTPFPWNVKR